MKKEDKNKVDYNSLDENYLPIFNMVRKGNGLVFQNDTIDEVINNLKEIIENLEESKEEHEYSSIFLTREGLIMRLDGNKQLYEQSIIMEELLKEDISFSKIKSLRDDLYDKLPTHNEIHAFELIKIISKHIQKLDELIDLKSSKSILDEEDYDTVSVEKYKDDI